MIRILLIIVVVGALVFTFTYHRTPGNLLVTPDQRVSWYTQVGGGSNAVLGVDQGVLCCNIAKSDGNVGGVEFWQTAAALRPGKKYHVSFTAKADQDHDIWLYVSHAGDNGYKTTMGLATHVPVPMEWKSFDFTFEATNADGNKDRAPVFALGATTGNIWFKNISMEEMN